MAKSACIYGDSGTFKTTNLGFAARYLYQKHRKKIRMVTAENHEGIDPYVNAGIIDLVEFTHEIKEPIPFLVKLSRGYWPNEKGVLTFDASKLKEVCAYFCEGLTSWSDIVMRDLRDKKRKISEEIVGSFVEDGINFGANPKSHYGFAQNVILDRIVEFGNLPVDRTILTAHEAKGEEQDTRNPIRGPGLAGKAGTDSVPRKVGSCIHFENYVQELTTKGKDGEMIATMKQTVRAFFVPHPDPKFPSTIYKCKARVPVSRFEELLSKFPGGYFIPTLTSGLDKFLEAEDDLNESTTNTVTQWKTEIDKKAEIDKGASAI